MGDFITLDLPVNEPSFPEVWGYFGAYSSVVEQYIDNVFVRGSNPLRLKRYAFGTPPKGVLEQRSFLIKIAACCSGGKAPNLNFDYKRYALGRTAFNNFVIGSDTSGIQLGA